jgi:hypothetical protein
MPTEIAEIVKNDKHKLLDDIVEELDSQDLKGASLIVTQVYD